jgi:GTPase SAR1 family protein
MKIGFCGTISVGKTTLVNELGKLQEFKDYEIITERSKYLKNLGVPLNTDSTILGQTLFLAERAKELLTPNIITDRTIIDVMAFSLASHSMNYLSSVPFCDFACNLISYYDYIFYVSPEGVDIEDNGVRETNSEYRKLIDEKIQNVILINRHRIKKYHEISGNIEERIKTVKESIFS